MADSMTDAEWEARLAELGRSGDSGDDARVVAEATRMLEGAAGPGWIMLQIAAMRFDAARRLRRWEDSLRFAEELERAFPESAATVRIATLEAIRRLGRVHDATAVATQVTVDALARGDRETLSAVYLEVAGLHAQMNDLAGALKHFRRAIELDPEPIDGAAYLNLASLHARGPSSAPAAEASTAAEASSAAEASTAAEAFAIAAVVVESVMFRGALATLRDVPSLTAAEANDVLRPFGVHLLEGEDQRAEYERIRSAMALSFELAKRPISLGVSDFRRRQDGQLAYIDKSMFVASVIAESANVILVTAPRRFGKSLCLSTLRYFLDHTGSPDLFDGLAVAREPQAMRFRRTCSVLYLSLLSVKPASAVDLLERLAEEIRGLVCELGADLDAVVRDDFERDLLASYRRGAAPALQVTLALRHLSAWLARSGRPVWVLIDEYDAPLQVVAGSGAEEGVLQLLRDFLSAGLKDNAALTKGVLTGVLRVARDSVFSGLNNVVTHPLHAGHLGLWLGFDDQDVHLLTNARGSHELRPVLKEWYDGYQSGAQSVYNPWSVLNFLTDAERPGAVPTPMPYWAHTGDPKLLERLLARYADDLRPGLVELLRGGEIVRTVDDGVSLGDLERSSDAFWPLMLYTGYLTAVGPHEGNTRLRIPNLEVRRALAQITAPWTKGQFGGQSRLDSFATALLAGDAPTVEAMLSEVLVRSVSHHDVTKGAENSYHMLFLGALAWVNGGQYRVTSNLEAGHGRLDVLLAPTRPGFPAAIVELKSAQSEGGLDRKAREALAQIRDRRYATALPAGVTQVHAFGVAAHGKHVRVVSAQARS